MWTAYPDHHEVLDTSRSGNRLIRGRYGRQAHAALQSPARQRNQYNRLKMLMRVSHLFGEGQSFQKPDFAGKI
jgi:hypothetical protein